MKKTLTILTMVAWAGVASAGTLFVEDFNDNSFGGNLRQMDTDGTGLVVENGSVHGEGNYRRYVATVDSDYNLSDWVFELDINAQDTGNGPGIALIGFGSAIRNPGVYDVPSSDDSYLQLGEGGGGGGINFYSPVIGGTEYNWGTFGGNGLKRVRISKSGNDLTFEVDTDYAGGAFTADWNRTINIGSAGYSSNNSRLFFGTYSDKTYFDNFNLSDSPRPDAALSPNPINSSDVFVDPNVASLSWATPDTHYTYDIYLSSVKSLVERGDASVLLAGDHTATSVNVSLSNAQRYYWRVDTINGGTKTGGETWTFVAGDPNDTGSSAYYVATNGSDLNAGTEASPFATVQRAASRIGCDLMAGATSDKTVYIRGGTYYLSSALTFTEWESPDAVNQTVTYKNYPGEKPVLVGGELLTDWTWDTGRIYKTYVGAGREFYSLFENGERSTMARTPNSGYFETETRGDSFTVFGFKSGDLPAFDYSDAQVYCWPGEPFWNWFSMTQPIVNIDWETRSITLENGDPTFYNLKTGNRYFVQGAKEFLDSPGEFYLDQSTGWLYYWPVLSPVADQNIVAATTKTLVQFKGTDSSTPVRNIILEGLELNGSDFDKAFVEDAQRLENVNEYGLVVMENAVSNTVRNCRLANAGYDGILLEKYAQDNTIEGNFIENIGSSRKCVSL